MCYVRVPECDGARRWPVEAVNEVEQSGLARSVRADHRCDLSFFHVETDVFDRIESAEAFAQVTYFFQCHFVSPVLVSASTPESVVFDSCSPGRPNDPEAASERRVSAMRLRRLRLSSIPPR